MSFLRQAVAVAGKDLRVEVRGRHALGAVLPFAATLLVAFGLSLGPGRTLLREAGPGLLWLAVLFGAVLAVRQSFQSEAEDGALEGLVLAPVDRAALFLGKLAAVSVQLLALEAVVGLLGAGLFDLTFGGGPLVVVAAFVLGTVGLAAVGTLFGALAESPRAREGLLPLLVLPLCVPVLVAGVRATALAAAGQAAGSGSWLGLLLAFDVVYVGTGALVFGHLLED